MPNIATVMKEEILRLARKEVRAETEAFKKASAKYRSEIAELKRRLSELEKVAARAERKAGKAAPAGEEGEGGPKVRFRAKGFASLRQKLGLSAAEVGTLIGVSAQTVYNWELEKTRPRASQLQAIAGLRKMGKRKVKAALEAATAAQPAAE